MIYCFEGRQGAGMELTPVTLAYWKALNEGKLVFPTKESGEDFLILDEDFFKRELGGISEDK